MPACRVHVVPREIQVHGDLDHHRARHSGSRQRAGATDLGIEVLPPLDTERRLGDGPRHRELVDVVQLVAAAGVAAGAHAAMTATIATNARIRINRCMSLLL